MKTNLSELNTVAKVLALKMLNRNQLRKLCAEKDIPRGRVKADMINNLILAKENITIETRLI